MKKLTITYALFILTAWLALSIYTRTTEIPVTLTVPAPMAPIWPHTAIEFGPPSAIVVSDYTAYVMKDKENGWIVRCIWIHDNIVEPDYENNDCWKDSHRDRK